jgi:opacity protein-like surface antigen
MRRVLFAAIVVVLVAGVAAAQDFPKVEIFGGYSLLRLGGSEINDLTDAFESEFPDGATFSTSKLLKKGFDASIAFNINQNFGIEAGFLYNRGDLVTASGTDEGSYKGKEQVSEFAFMAGPRFTIRKNDKVTPFVHALFGVNHAKGESSLTIDGEANDEYLSDYNFSDNGFGMAIGGGIDVNVNKAFGIRLIQADYFMAKHDEVTLNNLKLAFGVVFRLGGK